MYEHCSVTKQEEACLRMCSSNALSSGDGGLITVHGTADMYIYIYIYIICFSEM